MGERFDLDPCAACEEILQPFLDRQLSEAERIEGQRHLDACPYCAKRYRFEASLREFVRVAAFEEMAPELKQKLQSLRTPLI
jgi:anti-sigma factor (TIGR02949 family)